MEFEVVFFHNINNIVTQNDPSLVSRYLYVGLSRATFYMAVTTSGTPAPGLEETLSYFNEEKDWRI